MMHFPGQAGIVAGFQFTILILAATSAAADTEIHRCLLDDGTIAFQEMPCPEPAAPADERSEPEENRTEGETRAPRDDVFDFVNPYDEPGSAPPESDRNTLDSASQDRAECEKKSRDAIDAIDLEMRESTYTKEQGEEYLARLLALTQQLRDCKKL